MRKYGDSLLKLRVRGTVYVKGKNELPSEYAGLIQARANGHTECRGHDLKGDRGRPQPTRAGTGGVRLSHLINDLGIDALLAIMRDKNRPQDIREKALFWVVESDSDVAFEKIERVLSARE